MAKKKTKAAAPEAPKTTAKKAGAKKATAKKAPAQEAPEPPPADDDGGHLRRPAEERDALQLAALAQDDPDTPPAGWRLSPRAVFRYVVGGETLALTVDGEAREVEITRKFFGDAVMVENAIVTLASERALLLVGDPGTGKSWLSEHLAAAISGDSTLTIQGTAGTSEEHIKYSWNIARVIAEGQHRDTMIPSPTMVAMQRGAILRFEELTRCLPDVQDALVSILSDKAVAVPELPGDNMVWARPGFNVIATANSRDQGVNELSAALKRRFNYVHIPLVADAATEVAIVRERSEQLLRRYRIPTRMSKGVLELLTTAFREIRSGESKDGVKLNKPSTTLSTAEAIAVAVDATLHARYFGNGEVAAAGVARHMIGSVIKASEDDRAALKEYVSLVAKRRAAKSALWREFHDTSQTELQKK